MSDADHADDASGTAQLPVLHGERVTLVPVAREHVEELRRVLKTPEVWARWGDDDGDAAWPFDDKEARPYSILVDGVIRGMVQFSEENDSSYRHASIDIFLDPEVHGQGLGRDAVRTIALYLVRERGHHRLVIDPAADNEQAIRSYAAVGFRPVGIMREYERTAGTGEWHDALLMDLLAEELDPHDDPPRRPAGFCAN